MDIDKVTSPPSSSVQVDIDKETSPPPSPVEAPKKEEKSWRSYMSEDFPRTVQESTDSAIRSARSFQHSSSTHFRDIQEFLPQMTTQVRIYESAFFKKIKDEFSIVREHPALAGGLTVTAALLLMRGPRRFLFRHTLGLLQSEEAQFVRAERNIKELSLSTDIMKKESKKLLERAALAENEMKRGQSNLRSSGGQFLSLSKSVHKREAEANDLMDHLREIPGREALKLRAEVASLASELREQRNGLDKKILRISELGVPV